MEEQCEANEFASRDLKALGLTIELLDQWVISMQEPQRTQHPEKSGRNEELTLAIVHQAVFLFVTALTTTRFGDITGARRVA